MSPIPSASPSWAPTQSEYWRGPPDEESHSAIGEAYIGIGFDSATEIADPENQAGYPTDGELYTISYDGPWVYFEYEN